MCDGRNGGDFGCLKCVESILERKHGWIECKSTSFPGKVYYFHTETRCSTWRRPVPRNTQLPRYKKYHDSRSHSSPTNDQILPSKLTVSGSGNSFFTNDAPPSDFELHARRMQIYLQKNTDYRLAMEYWRGESLRDKLLECYKKAKSELAKNLNKEKVLKKPVNVPKVKPKTRQMNPVKTIRECHGIKTVSYDPVPSELPSSVKMPDLSETSVDSFTPITDIKRAKIFDENNLPVRGRAEGIAGHDRIFERSAFKELNLSESETSVSAVDQ